MLTLSKPPRILIKTPKKFIIAVSAEQYHQQRWESNENQSNTLYTIREDRYDKKMVTLAMQDQKDQGVSLDDFFAIHG